MQYLKSFYSMNEDLDLCYDSLVVDEKDTNVKYEFVDDCKDHQIISKDFLHKKINCNQYDVYSTIDFALPEGSCQEQ